MVTWYSTAGEIGEERSWEAGVGKEYAGLWVPGNGPKAEPSLLFFPHTTNLSVSSGLILSVLSCSFSYI